MLSLTWIIVCRFLYLFLFFVVCGVLHSAVSKGQMFYLTLCFFVSFFWCMLSLYDFSEEFLSIPIFCYRLVFGEGIMRFVVGVVVLSPWFWFIWWVYGPQHN